MMVKKSTIEIKERERKPKKIERKIILKTSGFGVFPDLESPTVLQAFLFMN